MWIIHFIGMPGSGKTTLAKLFFSEVVHMFSNSLLVSCQFLEMSSIVEEWVESRHQFSIMNTPLGDASLRTLFCEKLSPGINVVAGVREGHLLSPTVQELRAAVVGKMAFSQVVLHFDYRTCVVGIRVDAAERKRRYKVLGKAGKAFNEAEERALEMDVPVLLRTRCDFYAPVLKIWNVNNARQVCKSILATVLKKFTGGGDIL